MTSFLKSQNVFAAVSRDGSRYLRGFASRAALLAALAAPFALDNASAQAPAETSAGAFDIVVTAQRRETRLQETPIAVAAFGAEQIEEMGLDNVGDVIDFVPNVARTSGPTGGNDGFYFVRGIGQVDSNPAGDPGVGTYVDEVYLGRIQGASLDTLDIARIEVLRGPQGTLFGRNTIGGAVNIITADPGDEFETRVRGIVGERDRRELIVSSDLPVADYFGLKVSGFYKEQEGWGENPETGATFGDVEKWGGRIKAVWDVAPNFEVKIAADVTEGNGTSAFTVLTGFNPFAGPSPGGNPFAQDTITVPSPGGPVTVVTDGTPLGVPFFPQLGQERSNDQYRSFSNIQPVNELSSGGASVSATWDTGPAVLKSITAFRTVEQFNTNDFDGGAYSFYDGFFDTSQEQFSQEFQVSGSSFSDRLNWLTGVYYFDETIDHINGICLGTNGGIGGTPPAVFPLPAQRYGNSCLENNQAFTLDIKSWAAFANVTFNVTERLALNLGARYTDEEKKQRYNFFIDNTAGIYSGLQSPNVPAPIRALVTPGQINPTINRAFEDSWNEFTPKVGLDYKASDNIFLYASWAQGFKSGGFDGRPTQANLISSYDPEKIDTYEVGVKSDWFDNRLRLNASVFFSQYEDIQLLVVDPASGFFVLTNAGDSDIQGVELELLARPVDPLLIQVGLGYQEDEYQRLDARAIASGIGLNDSLPLTPDFTGNAGVQYEFGLGTLGDLALRADYNYRSEISYGAPNEAQEIQDGYGLLDLRATLTSPDQRVAFSVFGLNVTDEYYWSNAQDVLAGLGVSFAQIGPPAEWGAELSVKF